MGGIKKNEIKKFLRKLFRVKTWQLLIILILLLFIEATLLRFDHIKMTDLKSAVLAADADNNDQGISDALTELRKFVSTHTVINIVEKNGQSYITFGTGPIYLEKQYLRRASAALEAAEAEAGSDENPNGNVFAKAMDVCKPIAIANGWVWNSQGYIDCMTGEIAKYPTSETIQDTYVATLPSTALFRYDFASPVWSFTLSGIVAVVCAVLILIIIIRFLIWCVLRLALVFLKN